METGPGAAAEVIALTDGLGVDVSIEAVGFGNAAANSALKVVITPA